MRVNGWETALAAVVAERRKDTFELGKNDCCLFAADCVQAVTGVDPAASLRGYIGTIGAARVLRENGGLTGILNSRFEQIDVRIAQRGDVVVVTGDDGKELMAVVVGKTAVAPAPAGVAHFNSDRWLSAWRVA